MYVELVSLVKNNVTYVWVCLHVSAITCHLTVILLQKPGAVDRNMDDKCP